MPLGDSGRGPESFTKYTSSLGLDAGTFKSCIESDKYLADIRVSGLGAGAIEEKQGGSLEGVEGKPVGGRVPPLAPSCGGRIFAGESARTVNPAQTTCFLRLKRGFQRTLLTRDFLYSIVTFLTDAPLAQLDRALDYELSNQKYGFLPGA